MRVNLPAFFARWLSARPLAALALLAGLCAPAAADNWQASIYEYASPGHLVGVDKKKHAFYFFEKKSPFKLRYTYPCVTGQAPGDKMQINDLRTPEGIYFVEYKIANGLDFREYGGIAYTLNYPNPVDRLRGKTGHGIWIHSKGFELVPTRGCVAIGLDNIAEVGPLLLPGTPVVLAEELKGVQREDNGALAHLRGLMSKWSAAWAARSKSMFDFYDPDAYSRATENFALFRQNKERLFKILSFIKIYNREIHALEGPGYWVTWAEQFYTASNLSTEGIRRLYWQKNDKGEFRIVGMEWTPRDMGMKAAFQKGTLVAEASISVASDAEAPVMPRLDMPEQAEPASAARPVPAGQAATAANLEQTAVTPNSDAKNQIAAAAQFQKNEKPAAGLNGESSKAPGAASRAKPQKEENTGLRASLMALAENLLAISEPLVPRRQKGPAPDEIIWGEGKSMREPDAAAMPEADNPQNGGRKREKPAASQKSGQDETAGPRGHAPPTPALQLPGAPRGQEKLALNNRLRRELADAEEQWRDAFAARSETINALYDSKEYNRPRRGENMPRGMSLAQVQREHRREFHQPWLEIISGKPEFGVNGQLAYTRMPMLIVGPKGRREGMQTLWWRRNAEGKFRIVGQTFKPEPLGLQAEYLERASGKIADTIEAWRSAWEAGNIESYMSFYAPNAWQQGRSGAANIRRQKEGLWSRVKPASVRLSGLRVTLEDNGARADMTQAYADSAGRHDKGVKTIHLRYDGKNWLIQREDWASLPPAS